MPADVRVEVHQERRLRSCGEPPRLRSLAVFVVDFALDHLKIAVHAVRAGQRRHHQRAVHAASLAPGLDPRRGGRRLRLFRRLGDPRGFGRLWGFGFDDFGRTRRLGCPRGWLRSGFLAELGRGGLRGDLPRGRRGHGRSHRLFRAQNLAVAATRPSLGLLLVSSLEPIEGRAHVRDALPSVVGFTPRVGLSLHREGKGGHGRELAPVPRHVPVREYVGVMDDVVVGCGHGALARRDESSVDEMREGDAAGDERGLDLLRLRFRARARLGCRLRFGRRLGLRSLRLGRLRRLAPRRIEIVIGRGVASALAERRGVVDAGGVGGGHLFHHQRARERRIVGLHRPPAPRDAPVSDPSCAERIQNSRIWSPRRRGFLVTSPHVGSRRGTTSAREAPPRRTRFMLRRPLTRIELKPEDKEEVRAPNPPPPREPSPARPRRSLLLPRDTIDPRAPSDRALTDPDPRDERSTRRPARLTFANSRRTSRGAPRITSSRTPSSSTRTPKTTRDPRRSASASTSERTRERLSSCPSFDPS